MKLYLFAGLLASATLGLAQSVTVKAGTLIDGKGGVEHNVLLSIEGSKITHVGSAGRAKPTYDLSALTLTPGWIDTHVHPVSHFDHNNRLHTGPESPQQEVLYLAGNLNAMLQAGFTTAQSLGAPIDKDVRYAINAGVLPGPRLLTSIQQITENSGDPAKLREIVRQVKAEGGDVIKMFATASIRDGGKQTMTDQQIDAACGEAKAQGMRAVVHAHASDAARKAILAGCTGTEHGTFLLHNYLDNKPKYVGIGNYTEEGFAYMVKALPQVADVLRRARARQVKIVIGTDATAGSHGRNYEEFIYRVQEGGDKPMDALMSGTSVAAESLGLGGMIGTIAPDFEADLVAVEGNPLDDITAVRRAVFVMKGGRVIKYDPRKE